MTSIGFKVLLSVFIVFHLFCIIIFLNPNSMGSKNLPNFFRNYTNTMGLHYTVKFFSPNPGNEWQTTYRIIQGGELTLSEALDLDKKIQKIYYFPQKKSTTLELRMRLNNIVTLSSIDKNFMATVLAPFLCLRHKKAIFIEIQNIEYLPSNIEQVRLSKQNRNEYLHKKTYSINKFKCKKKV